MGIFYKHSEDKKYHIYRMKSRALWFGMMILIVALIVFLFKIEFSSPLYFFLLALLVVVILTTLIEYLPIGLRRVMVRLSGKEETVNGNIFLGGVIKLEK